MVTQTYLMLLVGTVSTSFIFFDSGAHGLGLRWWLWAMIPYVIIAAANRCFTRPPAGRVLVTAAAAVCVFGGLVIYHQGFYANTDALNALLFIFVPVYQCVVSLAALIIAAGLQKVLKR